MPKIKSREQQQLESRILNELSSIHKLAPAGEQGEVDAHSAFTEIAWRLAILAKSDIPALSNGA